MQPKIISGLDLGTNEGAVTPYTSSAGNRVEQGRELRGSGDLGVGAEESFACMKIGDVLLRPKAK